MKSVHRLILFKAKSLSKQEWVYGWYYESNEKHYIITKQDGEHILIDINTLCEYIGLNDRINQTPIFEFDVVKALNRHYDNAEDRNKYYQTFEVSFLNGCWMFGATWNVYEFFNRFIYIENISNIHDKKIQNSIDIGCNVKWKSQSQGFWKEKEGEVIAIVQPNINASKYLPVGVSASRCKFDDRSKNERLLVKVMGGAKGTIDYYYAPRISTVELIM